MWFVRFFLILMGAGIVYMVLTQETIPIHTTGRMSFSYSLWSDPVRFSVYFAAFAVFEWFLFRVHAGMAQEERAKRNRSRKPRDA